MENNKKVEALKLAYALKSADEATIKLAEVYFDIGITENEMNMMATINEALDALNRSYRKRFKNELN